MLPNLTPVTMYCEIIANVGSTLLIWGNPKFDYTFIIIHGFARMDYVSPSIQGSIQLRLVLCDLAMIYNKAFVFWVFLFVRLFLLKIVHLLQTDKPTSELMFSIQNLIWRSFQIWCHASIKCTCLSNDWNEWRNDQKWSKRIKKWDNIRIRASEARVAVYVALYFPRNIIKIYMFHKFFSHRVGH